MTGQHLTVRRLRWREPGPSRLAARHRLERALEAGSNASALRPEAILCVRRIATSFSDLDRLSDVLDAEIRNAAHPARGIVPANANAVLFADRAELLACLARDWCAATLGRDWWWPVLFPNNDFTNLVRRWVGDAAAIPAAVNRLVLAGSATAFLRRIAPGALDPLWRSLVETFALANLEQGWVLGSLTTDNSVATDSIPAATGLTPPSAPWISWLTPESSLPANATRFLVTAVLLERAAAKVRSAYFARAVAAWVKGDAAQNAPELDFTDKTLPAAQKDFSPAAGPENDPASKEAEIVLEPAAVHEAKPRRRADAAKDQGIPRSSRPELPV